AVVVDPAAGRAAGRRAGDGRADSRPALAHAGQAALAPADRAAGDAAVGKGTALTRGTGAITRQRDYAVARRCATKRCSSAPTIIAGRTPRPAHTAPAPATSAGRGQ